MADGRHKPHVKPRGPTTRDPHSSTSPRKATSGGGFEKPAVLAATQSAQPPTSKPTLSVARQNRHVSPQRAGTVGISPNHEPSDVNNVVLNRPAGVSPTRGGAKQALNQSKSATKERTNRNESPPSVKSTKIVSNRVSRSESPRSKGSRATPTSESPRSKGSRATPTSKTVVVLNESPSRKSSTKSSAANDQSSASTKDLAKEKIAASRKQRLNSESAKKSQDKSPDLSGKSDKVVSPPKKMSGIPRSKEK